MELPHTSLDTVPNLASDGRSALGANLVVDTGLNVGQRVLDVGALAEAGAQEGRVNGNQDPAPTLEENSREQKADPDGNLEASDEGHGQVVVLLDKVANGIRNGMRLVLRFGAGSTVGCADLLGWDDGWDDGGAGVGRNVEDRVDTEGQQSQVVLRREKPDKAEDCDRRPKVSQLQLHKYTSTGASEYIRRYWTFSSATREMAT